MTFMGLDQNQDGANPKVDLKNLTSQNLKEQGHKILIKT